MTTATTATTHYRRAYAHAMSAERHAVNNDPRATRSIELAQEQLDAGDATTQLGADSDHRVAQAAQNTLTTARQLLA